MASYCQQLRCRHVIGFLSNGLIDGRAPTTFRGGDHGWMVGLGGNKRRSRRPFGCPRLEGGIKTEGSRKDIRDGAGTRTFLAPFLLWQGFAFRLAGGVYGKLIHTIANDFRTIKTKTRG